MAKTTKTKGMHNSGDKKTRGRTAITKINSRSATRPNTETELKTEATRPIQAGGTKHRGDRRDTSRLYTGNKKHSARGSNTRADVKTRAR